MPAIYSLPLSSKVPEQPLLWCRHQFLLSLKGGKCFVRSISAANVTKVLRCGPPATATVLSTGAVMLLLFGRSACASDTLLRQLAKHPTAACLL